ncbi:hypothetical protein [Clostridium perfringens]|uniref:hypothetical protein n=1 Tax=Clostridium perfringens TaxID=1502 RepID=UPI0039E943B4
MFNKNDIENLKNDLEQLLGKTITYRYNRSKLKGGREEQEKVGERNKNMKGLLKVYLLIQ